jgi:hypothetical protein
MKQLPGQEQGRHAGLPIHFHQFSLSADETSAGTEKGTFDLIENYIFCDFL